MSSTLGFSASVWPRILEGEDGQSAVCVIVSCSRCHAQFGAHFRTARDASFLLMSGAVACGAWGDEGCVG